MIKGYKAFRKGLITEFDSQLEIGKIYTADTPIKWNENGFHFCANPEDTLRYLREFDEETEVAEVHSEGDVIKNDDEYNGNYDMYVTNKIRIDRVLTREQLFSLIVSRGEIAIIKMIQTYVLTQEEINKLANKSIQINEYLRYYQLGDDEAFSRKYKMN